MMLPFRHLLLIGTVCVALTGCAQNVWNKPGASQQDFVTDQYGCERDARQSGGFGTGLVGAIEVQNYFNRCMGAHGWSLQNKTQAQSAANATQDAIQSLIQERKACVSAIRQNPKYLPVAMHLSDLQTGKYSFIQMSDPQTPTPVEAALLRDYITEVAPCIDAFFNTLLPLVSPVQAEAFRANRSEIDALNAQLVRRQMSWGDHATRANQTMTDNEAKLRAAH